MEPSDYDKYFITETPRHREHPQSRDIDSDIPWCDSLIIDRELDGALKGAYLHGDLHGAASRLRGVAHRVAQPSLR